MNTFFGLLRRQLQEVEAQNWTNTPVLTDVLTEYRRRAERKPLRYARHIARVEQRVAELRIEWFRWLSELAEEKGENEHPYLPYKQGILSYMGYRVGKTGLSTLERRAKLRQIFSGDLPRINDKDYMDEWGPAGSPARLKKLAYTIWALANNRSRQSNVNAGDDLAIEHWALDLDYLHDEYYVKEFGFDWPPKGHRG